MSNMKRLTHAWIACAKDNDGYIQISIFGIQNIIDGSFIIEDGSLWPYCRDKSLYRCPDGRPSEQVTYAVVTSMGGTGTIRKLSDVPEMTTSRRMVFIDTGYLIPDAFAVPYTQHAWEDAPPVRHELGTCASFVDGHSEYWRWKDPRTVQYSRYSDSVVPWGYNHDLIRLQIAVWGQLGYAVP
jgi:hypothetical protein